MNRSWGTLLKVVLVAVLGLVLDKKPSQYDDENEGEYDPMDLALMIT
ncbi:MAG TPA: hypothetical protein VMW38_24635 [Terriglobia bacterium]|nr:hypothetical protein [Terriglobia bacterium]